MTVTTNDHELVRLFVQTRRAIYFDRLYRRHYASVLRTCRTYAAHSTEAHDLAQDVFVRVWHTIQTFTHQSAFHTWLQAVARNSCIDHLRRQKSRNVIFCDVAPFADQTSFDPFADDDLVFRNNQLTRALSLLPEDDLGLIQQHYLDRVPLRDLAYQYQLSEGAVKMRLLRARTRLRAAI
jgi:RNA polymerase sigma factor (sigma-70 family)